MHNTYSAEKLKHKCIHKTGCGILLIISRGSSLANPGLFVLSNFAFILLIFKVPKLSLSGTLLLVMDFEDLHSQILLTAIYACCYTCMFAHDCV